MKKIIFGFALLTLALSSCKNDTTSPDLPVVYDSATQNSYDDQAAVTFLEEHYLDSRGNIKTFTKTIVPSDSLKKLSQLNPVTLPSGVVYVMIEGSQPNPGKTIAVTDSIRLMSNTVSYQAQNNDNVVSFKLSQTFRNGVTGSGTPEVDPGYYYTTQKTLANDPTKTRSYYEIEGFGEALRKFKAYNIPDSDNYNLQGVIIVPSRAAFGKDPHFNYTGIPLTDRSFVFNFQVYKSDTRSKP